MVVRDEESEREREGEREADLLRETAMATGKTNSRWVKRLIEKTRKDSK